jgi:HNH endonuclease
MSSGGDAAFAVGCSVIAIAAFSVPIFILATLIPQDVKIAVSVRDGGKCRVCGSAYDLQYDHIIPNSLGGSSDDVDNIQLLCGRCNRRKSNRYVG